MTVNSPPPTQLFVFQMKYIALLITNHFLLEILPRVWVCFFFFSGPDVDLYKSLILCHVQLFLFYYNKDGMKRQDLSLCCTGSVETEINFGPLM